MKKTLILLAIFFTTSLFSKNILILNAYRQSFSWTGYETKGMLDTIKKSNIDIKYYIEDMNTKVFRPNEQREKNLLNYYTNKYKSMKFDAIIVSDDNAINFVRKYKNNPLFKNVKVFFCGINNLDLAQTLDRNQYTGIFEKKDPKTNYKIAKKVKKGLKTIYFITDDSVTGRKVMEQYKNELSDVKVNLVFLNSKYFQDIKNNLKGYEQNSVIFLLVFGSIFENGNKISTTKVIQNISKIYNNPILVHSNVFINIPKSNIIGGSCTDGFTHGMVAAQKMLEYLNGTKVEDIDFRLDGGNKIYLNVKNLDKFDISADDLGFKDAIYVNNNFSFWEKYEVYILSSILIIIIIILFAIVVTVKNKRLKEAADTFLDIFNNSLELNLLSYDNKIIKVNDYGIKILGYKKDDFKNIIGHSILDFIHPNDIPKVQRALKLDKSEPYELNILQKDGSYKTFLNSSINIKKDGKRMRFSSLVDISKVKEKDKLLFEQSKMAAMGEMIGNIAHQWRQPLSVITSVSSGILLKKEYGLLDDKFLEHSCHTIEENANYLSKTIDDFRNFIKGDRLKKKFALKEHFDSFIKLVNASAKDNHIEVITDIEDIKFCGYENELLQCYINIFNNSKDILKENSLENRYVFIKAHTIDKHLIISFKDNGGGIDQDILPKIFEPYFTTKHKSQGTGLGLHMTYSLIVDGMNGTITAVNETYSYDGHEYKGAKFEIRLPI